MRHPETTSIVSISELDEKASLDDLSPFTVLIQSLRGFAHAATFLPHAYHLWRASTEILRDLDGLPATSDSTFAMFCREAMFDHLVLRLRRMAMDKHKHSLGAAKICDGLSDGDLVVQLKQRAGKVFCDQSDALLAYVRHECMQLLPGPRGYHKHLAPLTLAYQAYLVRLAAHWRAAHMTLAHFAVGNADVRDVSFHVLMIARAIQRVGGPDLCESDFEELDRLGYENATRVIGHEHSWGLLCPSLDANIDMRVARRDWAK